MQIIYAQFGIHAWCFILSNGNSYGYDNGNTPALHHTCPGGRCQGTQCGACVTSRHIVDQSGTKDFTLNYDAENRLVSVTGAATANFIYDADGKQVKAVVDGVTTYYVGNHYEVKSSVVTKYYFAGTTRIAVRTGGTLSFLLSDHLGSSSVTTDAVCPPPMGSDDVFAVKNYSTQSKILCHVPANGKNHGRPLYNPSGAPGKANCANGCSLIVPASIASAAVFPRYVPIATPWPA